mmetsp:Transcript_41433/g.137772  ORF Transcript_41433/g.137772 Transcript_41433/m.137772 type:complete len:173 (+) Transcript_41433:114-632(+)
MYRVSLARASLAPLSLARSLAPRSHRARAAHAPRRARNFARASPVTFVFARASLALAASCLARAIRPCLAHAFARASHAPRSFSLPRTSARERWQPIEQRRGAKRWSRPKRRRLQRVERRRMVPSGGGSSVSSGTGAPSWRRHVEALSGDGLLRATLRAAAAAAARRALPRR